MAKLKEIEVGLGISLEDRGAWYKPHCVVKLDMDVTDTPAKRAEIFKRAWEIVTEQVEKQINEIVSR